MKAGDVGLRIGVGITRFRPANRRIRLNITLMLLPPYSRSAAKAPSCAAFAAIWSATCRDCRITGIRRVIEAFYLERADVGCFQHGSFDIARHSNTTKIRHAANFVSGMEISIAHRIVDCGSLWRERRDLSRCNAAHLVPADHAAAQSAYGVYGHDACRRSQNHLATYRLIRSFRVGSKISSKRGISPRFSPLIDR